MKRILTVGVSLGLFLGPVLGSVALAEPTTQPSTQPVAGSYEAYQIEGTAVEKQYKVLVPSNDFLADSNEKRAAVAAEATELLKKVIVDLDGMAQTKPANKFAILPVRANTQAELYALGDSATVSTLDNDAKLPGRDGLRAKRIVLRAHWYMAGQDATKLSKVVAEVDQLANAQPTDATLTLLISEIGTAAQDPDVKQNMISLLTDTMDNSVAESALRSLRHHDKTHALEGKPIVIIGKQPDGQAFTTADWKGKVVLVDFWAAWCGPCKAELPRVQKMYSQYHDKGFEVLGVDNDYTAKSVTAYAAKANLPWPQLFDADAGAKDAWNPITVSYGIDGIPVMFLIDKKGICRTVTARDNFEQLIPQLLAE